MAEVQNNILAAVFEKTYAATQKTKKSCFWILKTNVKTFKKRTYSFIAQVINHSGL